MSREKELNRRTVAEIATSWADREKAALFVGNGFLLREVFSTGDRPSNFYLFGGMGLAAAVACGYLEARPESRAVVIEGDGNFLMGLCSAAFCGAVGSNLTHIVFGNGSYESTGGQAVPFSEFKDVEAVARGLGYRHVTTVTTSMDLQSRLEGASKLRGPLFIWVQGVAGGPVPPRPKLEPGTISERFRSWALDRRVGTLYV